MSSAGSAIKGNPFPGLRPFREDEEHLFFGRERQIDRMIDKLHPSRFLAIVGTSGSGKSSLVNCGLRPALHRGLMASAGTAWKIAQFRPGSRPVWALAQALSAPGVLFTREPNAGSSGLALNQIVDATLRISALGIVDIYQQAYAQRDINLLVVVDQFEELFRYQGLATSRNDGQYGVSEEAVAFVSLLLEASTQRDCPIYVALTMRSDFLGDCAQLHGLPEGINEGQYLVPRLSRAERRSAIEGPIAVAGGKISPVLLTRLVNDVGDNPDQLSILQHALNRTWARCVHDADAGGELLSSHYEDIGSMAHALDRHAEKAWAELTTPRQQEICEKIFRALTDKGTEVRGIRRPTALSSLCALAQASRDEVAEILKVFRAPSRSFLMPPASEVLDDDTVIDISHESLMRVWERLRNWAEQEARSSRTYRRIAETAALYKAGLAGLIRDRELETLLAWWDSEKPSARWASQYQGDWELVNSLLEESKRAHYLQLAETEFERRWRRLWRPLLIAAFFGVFVAFLKKNIRPLLSVITPVMKGREYEVLGTQLVLLSFCVTILLAGSLAISWSGRRLFRSVAFDRILNEVSAVATKKSSESGSSSKGKHSEIASDSYAPFWRRSIAFLLDSCISVMILFTMLITVIIACDIVGGNYMSAAANYWIFGLAFESDWMLKTLMTASGSRATLGQRVMSIVVTDTKGNRLSFARASARYFATVISLCTYGIGFFIQPFMKRRQTLHDLITGCLVVLRAPSVRL